MANTKSTLPVTSPSAARRGVLLGALMALAGSKTTASAATAAPDTVQSVDAAAASLTSSLGRLHGGEWSTTVNHELGFVLIVQRPSRDGGAK